MKIIFVVSHFYPPVTGGEIYNYRLYKYLKNFYPIQIIKFDDFPYKFSGGFILRNFWILRKIIGKNDIVIIEDAVMSSNLFIFNLIIKLLKKIKDKKIKVVPLVHHLYYPLETKTINKFTKYWMERILLSTSDAIIVNSEFTRDEVRRIVPNNGKRILVAYPGLNLDIANEKKWKDSKTINLLFVGSVTKRKGVDTLIKALEILVSEYRVKNVKLHIVGSLDKEPEFSRKIINYSYKKLKDKVIFHGRVNDNKLAEIYGNTHIFVFPSLWEGFGMVIIEAMVHGLPIIASNIGPIPYLIKDGINGLLVNPGNPRLLARAIKKYIDNPNLIKKIGNINRKHAKNFDWSKTLRKIKKFLDEINMNENEHLHVC